METHLKEKTNQADIVCCLQHLQVSYMFSPLSHVHTCMLAHAHTHTCTDSPVSPSRVSESKSEKHFYLQLCFETEERARKLLQNVSCLLKPGGYFFGITPDSSTIWYEIVIVKTYCLWSCIVDCIGFTFYTCFVCINFKKSVQKFELICAFSIWFQYGDLFNCWSILVAFLGTKTKITGPSSISCSPSLSVDLVDFYPFTLLDLIERSCIVIRF